MLQQGFQALHNPLLLENPFFLDSLMGDGDPDFEKRIATGAVTWLSMLVHASQVPQSFSDSAFESRNVYWKVEEEGEGTPRVGRT